MLESALTLISSVVLDTIEALGYPGVFLLMFLGNANIPIPSEVIMTFSGFLVSLGKFQFWFVVLVGTLGDVSGSLVSYFIAKGVSRRLNAGADFKRAENWYKRFGPASLFFGKMIPFIRAFIAFPAGIFRVKLWKFLLLTGSGALIWSFGLTYIGFVLGENWTTIGPYFRKFDFVLVAVLVIGFVWWLRRHAGKGTSDVPNGDF